MELLYQGTVQSEETGGHGVQCVWTALNPDLQLGKNISYLIKCSFSHHCILLEANYLNS